ncbi:MAG: alpha/beta hydrolase [Pseudomonadales bacterium]|nr:alpha/beta hydrolase [Pseudomonadales bacterium]
MAMTIEKLQQVLRKQGAASPTDSKVTMEQRRKGMDKASFPVAEDITVEPVKAAGMSAEWLDAPEVESTRAVLYLHGGGYVIGSLNSHRSLAGEISRAAKARVLLIEYRLAPEHAYPAAVDDALAAYLWLLEQGFSATNTAIAGDSAGGGLTAALLVELRDQKLSMPGAAVCISPWSDLSCSSATYASRADADPMIQQPGIGDMASAYLQGADAKSPTASPNFADLTGFPPLLIQVGDAEVLLDDARLLHKKAQDCDVDSTLEVWDKMIHVWHAFHPMLDEGKQAISRIGEYLQKKWST